MQRHYPVLHNTLHCFERKPSTFFLVLLKIQKRKSFHQIKIFSKEFTGSNVTGDLLVKVYLIWLFVLFSECQWPPEYIFYSLFLGYFSFFLSFCQFSISINNAYFIRLFLFRFLIKMGRNKPSLTYEMRIVAVGWSLSVPPGLPMNRILLSTSLMMIYFLPVVRLASTTSTPPGN